MTVRYISTSAQLNGTATTADENTLTIIGAGISRISVDSNAIRNDLDSDNCDVRVDGTVIGDLCGVLLVSDGITDGHSLTVGLGGIVLGNATGASIAGYGASVLNYGQIGGMSGDGVILFGAYCSLVNHGEIYGVGPWPSRGVALEGANATLVNYGSITSFNYVAVSLGRDPNAVLENFGTISGGDGSSISGTSFADRVGNHGTLFGSVDLSGGDDRFTGSGGNGVSVYGGQGLDTLRGGSFEDVLSGGTEADRLIGQEGDDELMGEAGADVLRGGLGDDALFAGADNDIDVLRGGAGADTFVWTIAVFMKSAALADQITDFTSGEDQIDLHATAGLSFIGNGAFSSVVGQIRYTKAAGQLQIDFDGNGVSDFFVKLTPGAVLLGSDLIL